MLSKERIQSAGFVAVSSEDRLKKLNAQLTYAARRSAFYREHLGGIEPLTSLFELAALPTISAQDIKEHGNKMVCVPASDISRIVSLRTSGTTGKPKRLYFTQGDLQRTIDFFAEGMGWMCARGDAVGICMPCASPDGIGDLLARGLEKLGAVPVRCGMVETAAAAAKLLQPERCRVLVGIPWQMRLLALTYPHLRPETVLLSADYVPHALSKLLQEQWGCTVLNHFGMTETGYGCAVENDRHDGMYLRKDELIAEIIDPVSGAPLPYGMRGELVLTTLCRQAMPLIRCRTGDLASMYDDGRIEGVYGRIGADTSQYLLQEAFSPLPWLYDYATHTDETALHFHFELTETAPADAAAQLKQIAQYISGKNVTITTERISETEAHVLYAAKRYY